jgi:hypothetical protein
MKILLEPKPHEVSENNFGRLVLSLDFELL